jgi:hypothetical protein
LAHALLTLRCALAKETLPGDNGLLHQKFLKDAHLKLAKDCVSLDTGAARAEWCIRAEFHLERATSVAACITELLSAQMSEDRAAKKAAEIRLGLLLAKTEVCFEMGKTAMALERAGEAVALNALLPDRVAEVGVLAYNCGVKV